MINGEASLHESEELFNTAKDLASDNANFFKSDDSKLGQSLCSTFSKLHDALNELKNNINDIMFRASEFDFDDNTKANGFRSFALAGESVISLSVRINQRIVLQRSSYFFRKTSNLRDVESCLQVTLSLIELMAHAKALMGWCSPGQLFCQDDHHPQDLMTSGRFVNQYAFYGRFVGFQFCESMATVLKALSILMASFSEVYYGGCRIIDIIWNWSKYLIDPELRAKRIVNISQYGSADFCKTFWFLGEMEIMHRLPQITGSSLKVNRVFTLEPVPLEIKKSDGQIFNVPIPSAHKGPSSFTVRLLSKHLYYGMIEEPKGNEGMKLPSPGLVFHCHGGGFVAQSSKSHETYLRQWALELNCPILSVDYSLAPECPYPRALEEVFYAFCWALNNASSLGTTAERVILAGDSAGAVLNTCLTMRLIENGLRAPNGLFLAYSPAVINIVMSPSRFLCLMDPLLPFGFLMGCTKAYACSRELYAQSMKHESKLRRNISKPFSSNSSMSNLTNPGETSNGCHAATIPEEEGPNEAIDIEQATGGPVLMQNSDRKSILSKIASIVTCISRSSVDSEDSKLEEEMIREAYLPCPLDMLELDVPHDYYISPYYAPDDLLSRFPPVSFLTTHFDPFLDDCVEFAKKLRGLGVTVTLDVVSGLCHGFLNFAPVSKEASEASKKCVTIINQLLSIN